MPLLGDQPLGHAAVEAGLAGLERAGAPTSAATPLAIDWYSSKSTPEIAAPVEFEIQKHACWLGPQYGWAEID